MVEGQLELSYSKIVRNASVSTILGSLITPLLYFVWNYFEIVALMGVYDSPVSVVEMQLLCIPLLGYQLPSYLVSNLFCAYLFKRDLLKSAVFTYVWAGILGWAGSTGLLFVSGTTYDINSMLASLIMGIPSLLIYYVICLWLKPKAERNM